MTWCLLLLLLEKQSLSTAVCDTAPAWMNQVWQSNLYIFKWGGLWVYWNSWVFVTDFSWSKVSSQDFLLIKLQGKTNSLYPSILKTNKNHLPIATSPSLCRLWPRPPWQQAKVSQDSSEWHQAQSWWLSLPAWWLWAAHGHTYSSASSLGHSWALGTFSGSYKHLCIPSAALWQCPEGCCPLATLLLRQFLWPASQSQVWVALLTARGWSRKDRATSSTAERRNSSFWLYTELGKAQIHTHLHTALFFLPFKTDSRKKPAAFSQDAP